MGRIKSELGGLLLDRGAAREAAPLVREGLRTLEADPLVRRRWLDEARARASRLRN